MQRFYDVILDQFGNPANGVLVSVFNAGTTTPSTLYLDSDNALTATNVISNPFTTNASGIVAFAAANGQYTITYSGSSITPRTFTWVTLSDLTVGGGGGTTTNPVTFNNGGAGAVSGTTFDGSVARTISYNTLGAAPTVSPTFTTSATFSFLTNTRVPFAGAAGALTDNANFTYTVGTGLKIADATASSSSTTGALIVTGGIGVGTASFFGANLTCNGTLWNQGTLFQLGAPALASNISYSLYTAAGQQRWVQWFTGGNLRWQFGTAGETESGSDNGSDFSIRSYTDAGSVIDTVINIVRASGGKITLGATSRSVSTCKTANGADWVRGSISESLTLAAAASTDTTANLLPAGAIIEAVVVRVTTVIPTAATFSVGDATTAARFGTGIAVAANTTATCIDHWSGAVATLASGPTQAAAAKIRITPNLTPATATGVLRITTFYRQFTPPTS